MYLSNFMKKIFRGPTEKNAGDTQLIKNLVEVGDGGENVPLRCSWLGLLSLPRTHSLETNQANSLKSRPHRDHNFLCRSFKSCLGERLSETVRRAWGGGSVCLLGKHRLKVRALALT